MGIWTEGGNGYDGHEWGRIDGPAPTIQAGRPIAVAVTPDPPRPGGPTRDGGLLGGLRPPWKRTTVADWTSAPGSGLTAVSTFAGCGGSSLGYRAAGYRVLWASEFLPHAADCYEANHPGTPVDRRDIRSVDPREILGATGLAEGELDLLDGSPPCQDFSTAGRREKGWGRVRDHADGTRQRSDDLFLEFARVLGGLMPRAFVAENVTGLVIGKSRGYFREIVRVLAGAGYRVEARVLDAQWLGVPQARRRVFVVGVREDLGLDPAFPRPNPWRWSVRDACPWLGEVSEPGMAPAGGYGATTEEAAEAPSRTVTARHNQGRGFVARDAPEPTMIVGNEAFSPIIGPTSRPSPTITAGKEGGSMGAVAGPPPWAGLGVDEIDERVIPVSSRIRAKWEAMQLGTSHREQFNLKRTHPDRPSFALGAFQTSPGVNQVMPPLEPRKFTILEVKRLMGFPDDYLLHGTYAERWARLGNSVPPPVARAVGEALRDGPLRG